MKRLAPSLLSITLWLTGCAVGPDYHLPEVAIPGAFKEAGDWKPATPKDEETRGNWWEIYDDAELNALVSQIRISNQNVAAAAAQYRQAMALLGGARAAYYPTVGINLSATRSQSIATNNPGAGSNSAIPINHTLKLAFSASWEPDLWGQIARNVEANQASVQASQADLQSALLSAQATLVQTYCQLRATDALKSLLDQTVTAYERSLAITRNRYAAGVAARVDVAQAESQLKTTQAQSIDLGIQRARYEHAIAVLIGKPPADLSIRPTAALPKLPSIPLSMPSSLLERRPDIAAAERRIAVANAQIGIAQAAFFPAITLSGNGGYQNSSLSNLLTLPNRFWSIGPALALSLFDGGARLAQKEGAIAAYDKAVATYRQTVLASFQEVEDDLAALRLLAEEAAVQQAALQAAEEALTLTENQYRSGTVSYLNVVIAQATALTAQRNALDVAQSRLLASADLLKGLGGNWPVSVAGQENVDTKTHRPLASAEAGSRDEGHRATE